MRFTKASTNYPKAVELAFSNRNRTFHTIFLFSALLYVNLDSLAVTHKSLPVAFLNIRLSSLALQCSQYSHSIGLLAGRRAADGRQPANI